MHRLVGSAAVLALLSTTPAAPADSLAALPDRAAVSGSSPNWVGYAINSGGYTSVESHWTQPAVDCSQGDGTVVFWVGLDGWGSNAVEQTGTQAKCVGGAASYSAWWETYPTNGIAGYSDSVLPGDHIYAKVTYLGASGYELYLSDATQGWVEDGAHPGSSASVNQSAEIVAETPSHNGNLVALPDFGTVGFTGAMINGQSLTSAGAIEINLVRNDNTLAATSELVNGIDFTVNWQRNS